MIDLAIDPVGAQPISQTPHAIAVGVVLFYAVGVWGVWAATASAPAGHGPSASIVARLAARVLILLPPLFLLSLWAAPGIWSAVWLGMGGGALSFISLAASCICTTICLRCVARRARRPGRNRLQFLFEPG